MTKLGFPILGDDSDEACVAWLQSAGLREVINWDLAFGRDASDVVRRALADRKRALADELFPLPELPTLVGTEKQVAWANTLRQQALDDYRIRALASVYDGGDRVIFSVRDKLAHLAAVPQAKWWIDRRDRWS